MQALLTDVHLLILDEPLSGLDPNSQQELEHILLSLKQQGISILFTCHEKQLLENFADRIVTLANHTITENISAQKGAEQVYIEAIVHETFSAIELQKQSGFIHVAHNSNQNLIQLQIEKEYTNEMLQFLLHKKHLSHCYNLTFKSKEGLLCLLLFVTIFSTIQNRISTSLLLRCTS